MRGGARGASRAIGRLLVVDLFRLPTGLLTPRKPFLRVGPADAAQRSPAREGARVLYLIVGLGNPGDEYAHTRHNAGFDAVDAIAEEIGVRYWKTECGALTGKGAYHDIDVVLAKPQSYMNTSGGPVKQLMNAYGVDAEHLVVIHDELDIDPAPCG